MTNETSAYEAPPPPAATAAAGWVGSDLAIGSALIVLLIALFLPWFSATINVGTTSAITGTENGMRAHGYLWAVFALIIVAMVVLVARDSIGRLPGNLPSPEQVLIGATGLALVLTVLGVAFKPSGATPAIPAAISVGWSYGGFVALLAAAVAFIAAFGIAGPMQSADRAARAARAAWRRPGKGA